MVGEGRPSTLFLAVFRKAVDGGPSPTMTVKDCRYSSPTQGIACMASDKDLDRLDREILRLLAADASLSLADIASRVGLTPTPCWKRIRRMEQDGVILGRVATIDPAKVGLPVSVFVAVETADHSSAWLQRFADVVAELPEIVDAWRMSGDVDYVLHVVVPDISAYDDFYRRLIAAVPLRNVTSRFSMERLKAAPLPI
jgi:Lrp/AsnC family transcriptional regulator